MNWPQIFVCFVIFIFVVPTMYFIIDPRRWLRRRRPHDKADDKVSELPFDVFNEVVRQRLDASLRENLFLLHTMPEIGDLVCLRDGDGYILGRVQRLEKPEHSRYFYAHVGPHPSTTNHYVRVDRLMRIPSGSPTT